MSTDPDHINIGYEYDPGPLPSHPVYDASPEQHFYPDDPSLPSESNEWGADLSDEPQIIRLPWLATNDDHLADDNGEGDE